MNYVVENWIMKSYALWLRITIFVQIISAAAHLLSLIADSEPRNESKKQLIDLVNGYHWDTGARFNPTHE